MIQVGLFFTFYNAKTTDYVDLNNIPKHMQNAVIAAEDRDFYNHSGFSIKGIARAFVNNIKSGEIREGGSTIPQELIKISLLTSQKSYFRKLQEVILSIELERRYSKEEILEMYLNSVYFGEGAFGIQNASQIYFGKDASELTLSESAILAGILPAPSALSPVSNNPENAYVKQKQVLNAMLEEKLISEEDLNTATNAQLNFTETTSNINNIAPHFALYVKDQLIEKYGEEKIIRSGFEVKTTLNTQWQKEAEAVLSNQVNSLKYANASNGAIVAIDPKTGAIKVMVGSHDWFDEENGKINMAVTPRQPGSSFKPIIYAKALEEKLITPATILHDVPTTFGTNYKPKNYDSKFRGNVTVRHALTNRRK